MNRIDRKFDELIQLGKKALITFITAGDPDMNTTEKLVLSMLDNGADIVELGVPFSDPIAEGTTIQNASKRSLDGGTTLLKIFDTVKNLRKKTDAPLILMMYLNTIFRFGTERFFSLCSEVGIDGVIVPDMPFEERDEIQGSADSYNIHSISLVAPTSSDRIAMIANESKGFLYCVSSTGVTGTRSSFSTDFNEFFGTIKKHTKIPCAVGFGISSAEQAHKMKNYCNGIIVGSAIVKLIEEHKESSVQPVSEFVSSLRKAIDAQ